MEIQLTKTKTITIGEGGGAKKKSGRAALDVVGLDLFSGDKRGVPAVRLTEKKGVLHLAAVGFVPAPAAALPASWEEAAKACTWALPAHFQSPHAAIAVTSSDMFLAQTTRDAFKSDFTAGSHHGDSDPAAAAGAPRAKKFSLRRDNTPHMRPPQAEQGSAAGSSGSDASPSNAASSAASRSSSAAVSRPTSGGVAGASPTGSMPTPEPQPGIPLSNGGTRFVMKPLADSDEFVLEAGLPEYQILWLSRLLPEGKRPTAASVQLRPSALAASVIRQPSFASKGASLALFLADDGARIVGYRDGDVILWRECRRAPGWIRIKAQLKKGLGLDDEAVLSVLEDTLIDPRPVLEPLVAPLLDELAVSRDYLVGKLGLEVKNALLMGLPAGGSYWSAISEDRIHLPLVAPSPFDGIDRAEKLHKDEQAALDGGGANAFLGALGAALAYIGEERAE